MFKRGDIVKATQDIGTRQRPEITEERTYVVSNLATHGRHEYLVVLGDDGRGHSVLASLFKPTV